MVTGRLGRNHAQKADFLPPSPGRKRGKALAIPPCQAGRPALGTCGAGRAGAPAAAGVCWRLLGPGKGLVSRPDSVWIYGWWFPPCGLGSLILLEQEGALGELWTASSPAARARVGWLLRKQPAPITDPSCEAGCVFRHCVRLFWMDGPPACTQQGGPGPGQGGERGTLQDPKALKPAKV